MVEQPIHIAFNKATAIPVREPFLNSYGFDLTDESQIGYTTGGFKFTVMGFRPMPQYDTLIATVKVALHPHVQDECTNILKLDLFNNDRLNTFCRTTAFQLKANEDEVKKALYSLRERLGRYRLDELKNIDGAVKKVLVTAREQKDAMAYLKSDNLMDSIEGLLKQAGVVTEMEKALQLFFILLSRHLDKPLHVLFQGSPQLSRMLMDSVTATVPEEHIHEQTSMSASSMYYTRTKGYWKNKVLHLKSFDKQFKGANTIKEFIDNGVLKRHTTESDYQTRQLYASNKTVEGAICLLGYCDDETLINKFFQECFFIRLEENEQNRADMLHHLKMESGGFTDTQQQDEAIRQLVTIQRLIKPLRVVIPYAMELELPEGVSHQLRSLPQLLTFIKSVALLHQHQLSKKTDENGAEYIEATTEHLQIAIELFKSIAITKADVLSQVQRSFIERLKTLVIDKENEFKIPDVMKTMKMSSSSFYRELNSVKEFGYVVQSGGNKKKGILYKIAIWDDFKLIQDEASIWNEQLKTIKKVSFPEVSQKIPKKQKQLKQA